MKKKILLTLVTGFFFLPYICGSYASMFADIEKKHYEGALETSKVSIKPTPSPLDMTLWPILLF